MKSARKRRSVAPMSSESKMDTCYSSIKKKPLDFVPAEEGFMQWVVRGLQTVMPDWFINYCANQVRESLPFSMWIKDLRKLPSFWLYLIGLSFTISFWSVAAYFTYITYVSSRTSPFISLSRSSGDCEEVPKAVTGTFLVSVGDWGLEGFWETDPRFNYNSTAFELRLTSYIGTTTEFGHIMEGVREEMIRLGDRMLNRDYSHNLIVLATFGISTRSITAGEFSFKSMGNVPTIYDRLHNIGAFSSGNNLCHYPTTVSYNTESSVVSVVLEDYGSRPDVLFDDDYVLANETMDGCGLAFSSDELGYDAQYDGNDVSIYLDMRSFSVAVAVNSDILRLDELEKVSITSTSVYHEYEDGQILSGELAGYYDAYYPGMDLVYCITFDNWTLGEYYGLGSDGQCVVNMAGSTYALPLSNSFGTYYLDSMYDNWDPEHVDFSSAYCSCNSSYTFYNDSGCGAVDLMPAWVFFKDDWDHSKLFNLSLHSYIGSITHEDGDIFMSKRAFPAIALNEFSNLNEYYFDIIGGGHCKDSLYHPEMMDSLKHSPPLFFVEKYFECVMTTWDALFQAAGLAMGNAPMIVVVQHFIMILAISIFLRKYRGFEDGITEFEVEGGGEAVKAVDVQQSLLEVMATINSSRQFDAQTSQQLNKLANNGHQGGASDQWAKCSKEECLPKEDNRVLSMAELSDAVQLLATVLQDQNKTAPLVERKLVVVEDLLNGEKSPRPPEEDSVI